MAQAKALVLSISSNMKQLSSFSRQIYVLLISLSLSILSGFVPDWTGVPFSTAEQILLSVALFIGFLQLDILYKISEIEGKQTKEFEMWRVQSQGDQELINIRSYFAAIVKDAHGPNDLFVSYFMKDLQDFDRRARNAAERQELRASSDYIVNVEGVFDSFLGEPEKILKYTWPLAVNERLFEEPAWRRFFEVSINMLESKNIEGIRVLFVLEDMDIVKQPIVIKLLDYFYLTRRLEAKLIKSDEFRVICSQNGLPSNFLDFGIYGRRMLFRSEQYIPEYVGVYTKDVAVVRMYIKLFDEIWNSPGATRKHQSSASGSISLEDLFLAEQSTL